MNVKPIKMGLQYGVCYDCQLVVPIERPFVNHQLHLILTLATVGLWGPVWIFWSVTGRRGRCTRCGSENVGRRR